MSAGEVRETRSLSDLSIRSVASLRQLTVSREQTEDVRSSVSWTRPSCRRLPATTASILAVHSR
jgi:hypothetical protein